MKTWREHAGLPADYALHCPTDVERAMLAEIAELRKIEARYQFLRDENLWAVIHGAILVARYHALKGVAPSKEFAGSGDKLDAAIDAAMKCPERT